MSSYKCYFILLATSWCNRPCRQVRVNVRLKWLVFPDWKPCLDDHRLRTPESGLCMHYVKLSICSIMNMNVYIFFEILLYKKYLLYKQFIHECSYMNAWAYIFFLFSVMQILNKMNFKCIILVWARFKGNVNILFGGIWRSSGCVETNLLKSDDVLQR